MKAEVRQRRTRVSRRGLAPSLCAWCLSGASDMLQLPWLRSWVGYQEGHRRLGLDNCQGV